MKVDIAVNIDRGIARLGKMPDAVRAELKAAANSLAGDLRDKAKEKAGTLFQVRSGEFVRSIKKSVRTSPKTVIGKVYSTSKIAIILERGARPHDIAPKNAKALAFLGQFAEAVHHPGFQGHTIINAAFQEMKDQINGGLTDAVKRGVAIDANAV